jgi:hypothetical protein
LDDTGKQHLEQLVGKFSDVFVTQLEELGIAPMPELTLLTQVIKNQ